MSTKGPSGATEIQMIGAIQDVNAAMLTTVLNSIYGSGKYRIFVSMAPELVFELLPTLISLDL